MKLTRKNFLLGTIGATFGAGHSESEAEDRALSVLERTGLLHQANALAGSLRLLDRKRLELARALATEPEFVIADEPTASVDQANAERIFALFAELVEQSGVAAIVATHDRDLAAAFDLVPLEHDLVPDGDRVLSRFRMVPA